MGSHFRYLRETSKTGTRNHDIDCKNTIFGLQEGHRSFGDMAGDSGHLGIAGILLADPS
jgi:hypothetical protein